MRQSGGCLMNLCSWIYRTNCGIWTSLGCSRFHKAYPPSNHRRIDRLLLGGEPAGSKAYWDL